MKIGKKPSADSHYFKGSTLIKSMNCCGRDCYEIQLLFCNQWGVSSGHPDNLFLPIMKSYRKDTVCINEN